MAAVMGLAATLLALGVATLGGAGATALEWSVYDRGVFARAAAPVSPALLVVARDPASEARFGTGSWDRAVLARLITSLTRAGAAAIGFDVPLGQPSAPGRGGASSDALLSQATALTNAVVYPISLELTHAAPLDGHSAAHRSWLPGARMPLALPAALPPSRQLRRAAPAQPRAVPRHLEGGRRAAGGHAPEPGRRQDRARSRRARAR